MSYILEKLKYYCQQSTRNWALKVNTSKQPAFNVDSMYIKFITFRINHQI